MPTIKEISSNKKKFIEDKLNIRNKQAEPQVGESLVLNSSNLSSFKSNISLEDSSPNKVNVKVVANTAWICDSYMDVLTSDAYTNSIKVKKTIPHLLDHQWSATGHIGDVTSLYTEEIPLKDLGINSKGSATCLVMESTVKEEYNPKAFMFYKEGKINQHSIGLSYKRDNIFLALNSSVEGDEKEKAVWDANIDKIINKDIVLQKGYFWLITEVDLLENSAVLFGANPITPTLETKSLQLNSLNLNNEEIDMQLEEALTEIASLKAQVTTLKAEVVLKEKEVLLREKARVKTAFEAIKTFGLSTETAIGFIEKDISVELIPTLCESIKSLAQLNNPSPPGGDLKSSPTSVDPMNTVMANLKTSLESLDKQSTFFHAV